MFIYYFKEIIVKSKYKIHHLFDKMENICEEQSSNFSSINVCDYYILFDKMVNLFKKIQPILLINLNDLFKKKNLLMLKENKLVQDTIKMIQKVNFDFNALLHNEYSTNDISDNEYISLSNELKELLSDKCIESNGAIIEEKFKILTKNKKNLFKKKKEHEVTQLAGFINSIFKKTKMETMLEMGCGKSYLTNTLLKENPNCLYIGIDMKEKLVEKTSKFNDNENVIVLYGKVTASNFKEYYTNNIKQKLVNHKKSEKNIFLFGLHSCGNLTSDTLKLFVNYDYFSHLSIVSCCLNLLTEYVTPEATETQLFKDYYENVGTDLKGEKLEQTILFQQGNEGYPLSDLVKKKYPTLFLSRTVRNSAMQKNTETSDINSLLYRKIKYRTFLQVFFEIYIPELSLTYGFGKVELNEKDTFKEYLLSILNSIYLKQPDEIKNKIDDIKSNSDDILQKFLKIYDVDAIVNILWGVNMIRMKFSKLIEYIIALDRIIYLFENNIYNIRLIKTFNESLSTRNILIYASKDYYPKKVKKDSIELEIYSAFNNESQNVVHYYKEHNKLDENGDIIMFFEKSDESLLSIKKKFSLLNEPISEIIVMKIIVNILQGLLFINQKGYCHQNLTLENIMVKYNNNYNTINIEKEDNIQQYKALNPKDKFIQNESFKENLQKATYKITNFERSTKLSESTNKNGDLFKLGLIMYYLLTNKENNTDDNSFLISEQIKLSKQTILILNKLLKCKTQNCSITELLDDISNNISNEKINYNEINVKYKKKNSNDEIAFILPFNESDFLKTKDL